MSLGLSGDQIPVGARFFAAVQTSRGAHPASYTLGTRSLSRGVKCLGHGVDHPPPSSARVKERVELYLYSPSGSSWLVLGRTLPFTYVSVGSINIEIVTMEMQQCILFSIVALHTSVEYQISQKSFQWEPS
jgi:hypothetical protein